MSINVNRVTNSNISSIVKHSVNFSGRDNSGYDSIYMSNQNNQVQDKTATDKHSFSLSNAILNLGKGLISPVTSMFSSPKNFLIGTGMIAGSIGLLAATGGAAAPILVAAGVGMGTLQAGKAVYKMATAKNSKDVEDAFYDIGGATSTIGLSVWGAKPALRQAGIATDDLGILGAIKKCFTSSKDLAHESYDIFASGYYKTNLANARKILTSPKQVRKYSSEFYKEGKDNYAQSFDMLRKALPENLRDSLKGRSKCELSIFEKITRRLQNIDDEIKQIKENDSYTPSQKQQAISDLLAQKEKIKTDSNFARTNIEDLLGARLTIDDVNPANIDKLVNSLAESAKKGDIEILEVENYRAANPKYPGQETQFYFSEEQVRRLSEASESLTENFATKKSGYTAVQLKIRPKGGKVIELQIRGRNVDAFADLEHIPYDLRQGKDIAKGNNSMGIILSPIKKAINGLSKEQLAQYNQYIYDQYVYAQKTEFGLEATPPKFPENINPVLSIEHLSKTYEQINGLQMGKINNPLIIYSQLPIIAGTNNLTS